MCKYYGSGDTGISAVDEQSCESPPHQLNTINKRKAGDDHFSEESMLAKRLAVDLSLVPRGQTAVPSLTSELAKPALDRVRRHGQHGAVSPGVSPQPRRKIIKSKRLLRMSRGTGEHDALHSSAPAFTTAGPAVRLAGTATGAHLLFSLFLGGGTHPCVPSTSAPGVGVGRGVLCHRKRG